MNGYDRRQLSLVEGKLVYALMQVRIARNDDAPMSDRERALRCAYARRHLLLIDRLLERADKRLLARDRTANDLRRAAPCERTRTTPSTGTSTTRGVVA